MDSGNKPVFIVDGVVAENLPNTMFRVKLSDGKIILCHLAGKLRLHYIKLLPGDAVRVEMNKLDLSRGRIVFKQRN